MLEKLNRYYERYYAYIAIAALSALFTAALAFSPLGAKIKGNIVGAFEPDEASGAGLFKKLQNDYGVYPYRFLGRDGVKNVSGYVEVDGAFARPRSAKPLLYSRDRSRTDAFVIVGAFEFPEGLQAAVLVDRKGRILHRWMIPPLKSQSGVFRADYRVFPHGFALARDGSAVIAFDNGARLIRIDACGNLLWRQDGPFHHAVTTDPEDANFVWTWKFETAERVALSDGKALEVVRMPKVDAANPGLDILHVRERDAFAESTPAGDPIHYNDVEPLPADLAPAFPMFSAGDLLVSARSLDLIFVVDRKTLKVKWHASGFWRRQHDPDWGRDGRIYVFSNNMNRGPTSIIAIDPRTNETQTVVDGARYGFYTHIRGKQHWSKDGRVVLALAQQGRAVELDRNGIISFDFLNRFDAKTGASLFISDAFPVDEASLDFNAFAKCSN